METESFLNMIQTQLASGTDIPNWTVDKGLLGDSFTVVNVSHKYVDVVTPAGNNVQHIPINDFEAVAKLWQQYINKEIGRNVVRDKTRFSKYIISILRWIEKGGSQ
jgi:hypothetical protein